MTDSSFSSRIPTAQQSLKIEKGAAHEIGGLVDIEINGKKFQVPFGTSILEACKEFDFHIPTLCYHDDLCIAGVCEFA